MERPASAGVRRALVAAWLVLVVNVGLQPAGGQSLGLCETLILPWGYPCTEHTVETEDGYLLGVQHIPNGVTQPSGSAPRPPVFLQHGLFGGGDNWVLNQPSESFAFILADAGYDVWIGNIRGIAWSHGHVNLTPADAEFWAWSWDELAAYDLPAMLTFVHNQTESEILYVGHSQGTTMMVAGLVGTAQAEAMTSMLAGAVLICPIVYMMNITSEFDKFASDFYLDQEMCKLEIRRLIKGCEENWNWVDFVLKWLAKHDGSSHQLVMNFCKLTACLHTLKLCGDSKLGQELVEGVCGMADVNCTDIYQAVYGKDCCLNDTRVPFYLNFYPQPTSSNNIAHFAQMIRMNTFSMYDYGPIGNWQNYQQLIPPAYDVANLPNSVPLVIINGGQDSLADPVDVEHLTTMLGSKVMKTLMVDRYSHGDFVQSTSANVDVYPEILQFLRNMTG